MAVSRPPQDNATKDRTRRRQEGSIGLRPTRTTITIAMNALVVVALLLSVRAVVDYFGVLSGTELGTAYLRASGFVVLPLGFTDVRSLYGGVFDPNAALTVIIFLAAEWGLSVWRSRL